MEKKHAELNSGFNKLNRMPALMLFGAIALLMACNNKTKKTEAEPNKDSMVALVKESPTDVADRSFKMHIYLLTAQQQMAIFKGHPEIMELKVTFKRFKPDATPNDYTIDIVGANGGKLPDGDLEIGNADDLYVMPATDISFQTGIRHWQRITRKNLRILYNVAANTPIDQIPFKDLLFTPKLNAQNMIVFAITFAKQPASAQFHPNRDGEIYSNPSPPARPCDMDGTCDQN